MKKSYSHRYLPEKYISDHTKASILLAQIKKNSDLQFITQKLAQLHAFPE